MSRLAGGCVVGLLVAGAVVAPAAAQDGGRITGIVVADRGGPIGEVEVVVQRSTARTTTGANGRFQLTDVPAGVQVLVFRRIGYRPQAITLAVTGGTRVLGAVVLEAGSFLLPELTVTAKYAKPARYANTTKYDDFYRRRNLSGGIFLDRDALDQRLYMYTHQVFQGLPGVRVENGPPGSGSRVWFNRCNESPPAIALFIDGKRMIPPWGTSKGYGLDSRTADRGAGSVVDDRSRFVEDMIDTVNPAEIEAIEVFKGPGQLPAEFNNGDNCGAIVIWTRQGGYRVIDSTGTR